MSRCQESGHFCRKRAVNVKKNIGPCQGSIPAGAGSVRYEVLEEQSITSHAVRAVLRCYILCRHEVQRLNSNIPKQSLSPCPLDALTAGWYTPNTATRYLVCTTTCTGRIARNSLGRTLRRFLTHISIRTWCTALPEIHVLLLLLVQTTSTQLAACCTSTLLDYEYAAGCMLYE